MHYFIVAAVALVSMQPEKQANLPANPPPYAPEQYPAADPYPGSGPGQYPIGAQPAPSPYPPAPGELLNIAADVGVASRAKIYFVCGRDKCLSPAREKVWSVHIFLRRKF